jgi:hypothetical protein
MAYLFWDMSKPMPKKDAFFELRHTGESILLA